MDFTDRDLVAATAALSIVILLFFRHEAGALMDLRDRRLISAATYKKKFGQLQGLSVVLVVAAALIIGIVYQFIPHSN